jgi:hypothetical protein
MFAQGWQAYVRIYLQQTNQKLASQRPRHPHVIAQSFSRHGDSALVNGRFKSGARISRHSHLGINADKRRAARLYIETTKEKRMSEDDLFALFNTSMEYTKTPHNVAKMVDFLHSIGSVKTKPASWRDLFFPEAHGLPGS